MSQRFEGANQLNEIIFQDNIDSFPVRDNFRKIEDVASSHATEIEALLAGDPASGAEVVAARDGESTLSTSISKTKEVVGDGLISGELDEGDVTETGIPGTSVFVESFRGIINGVAVNTSPGTQTVTPANFSLGETNPRIDVVYVGSSGTAGVVTGTPAASPEIEQVPNNTVILGYLYLRPSGANPNVPNTIRDSNNGTDSFIVKNLQRFFLQKDDTEWNRSPFNHVLNGGFSAQDLGLTPRLWSPTNATFVVSASDSVFGDHAALLTGAGGAGATYAEYQIDDVKPLRGKWVTISAYLKLSGSNSKTGRLTIRMVGDTPEQDTSFTDTLNDKLWQRIHGAVYIDNSVTSLFIRLEVDTTAANTTAGFVDGIQLNLGKIASAYEYPEIMKRNKAGELEGDLVLVDGLSWNYPPPFPIFEQLLMVR